MLHAKPLTKHWRAGKFVLRALPICFIFLCFLNFVVYAWVGIYPGIVFTLIFLTCSVALYLLQVWSKNDNYLPPKTKKVVDRVLAEVEERGVPDRVILIEV